ncbi:461_t:CDS:2 [Gigaspora margarita]|uniref:461_t:CDS:1 n=1 Tax=Gigaspora margarita TaxID=4874 RepID=A0ABN7V837_GIGMA|nr:461_t:CDS:2 [Gigaspora margarita]
MIKSIFRNEDFDEGSANFASGSTISNSKVYDSFQAAAEASEKKITEIDESTNFPTLTRTHHFLENNQDFDTEKFTF